VSYFFFEDFFAAFLAGFFAAFFFAAISYLLLHEIWTRWSCDLTGSMSTTPRVVSPRALIDEDSETLAVSRNGPLSRVGSVATVVATTSRIAIQSVVILDEPHSRQSLARIFFKEGCGNF
jgi:hypothetical protein